MKLTTLARAACVALLAVLAAGCRAAGQDVDARETPPPAAVAPAPTTAEAHRGFLYGRVTTDDGGTYVGRLRFGREEEAFWGDYFNGVKPENPWAARSQVPELTRTRRTFTIFGFEIPLERRHIDLGRPFMARFGDIGSVEMRGSDARVVLKSGTVVDVAWSAASDFDDGLRVWDETRGVIDLASWAGGIPPPARVRLRRIEFLPTARLGAAPARLHGTVRARRGVFTGFVQWDRKAGAADDELVGRTADGPLRLRFDTIRSLARRSSDSSLVTLVDGREIVLSGSRASGDGNRGVYVDDPRYGRVLVSWDVFERVEFSAAGSGPAYTDFPPGRPLTGTVSTNDGRRLTGRLVYDLDESETTETLDAPHLGVNYTIPFGLIASIVPAGEQSAPGRASVRLHDGEELPLDRAGDLGDGNGGVLIFAAGRERPEYVRWSDVQRIDLDRPAAMYPPLRRR